MSSALGFDWETQEVSVCEKILVIGLDCAPPELVFEKFAGQLPNLDSLRQKSRWGRLESVVPPKEEMTYGTGMDRGRSNHYAKGMKARSQTGPKGSSTSEFLSATDLPHVPVNQSPVAKFREYLDQRNLKWTGKRLKIVEHVFEKHDHFDADQLIANMRQKDIDISRSTVYRTLTLLVEAGLLRELQFGSRTAYDHDYGYPAHEHLVCEKCGNVIEFINEELENLQDEICQQNRFRPTHHKFIIYGVCEKCNRTSSPHRKLDLI